MRWGARSEHAPNHACRSESLMAGSSSRWWRSPPPPPPHLDDGLAGLDRARERDDRCREGRWVEKPRCGRRRAGPPEPVPAALTWRDEHAGDGEDADGQLDACGEGRLRWCSAGKGRSTRGRELKHCSCRWPQAPLQRRASAAQPQGAAGCAAAAAGAPAAHTTAMACRKSAARLGPSSATAWLGGSGKQQAVSSEQRPVRCCVPSGMPTTAHASPAPHTWLSAMAGRSQPHWSTAPASACTVARAKAEALQVRPQVALS